MCTMLAATVAVRTEWYHDILVINPFLPSGAGNFHIEFNWIPSLHSLSYPPWNCTNFDVWPNRETRETKELRAKQDSSDTQVLLTKGKRGHGHVLNVSLLAPSFVLFVRQKRVSWMPHTNPSICLFSWASACFAFLLPAWNESSQCCVAWIPF